MTFKEEEMLTRIYGLMWLVLATTTAGLYLGGHMNYRVVTAVLFVTVTLVVIGMSILLPLAVSQRTSDVTV